MPPSSKPKRRVTRRQRIAMEVSRTLEEHYVEWMAQEAKRHRSAIVLQRAVRHKGMLEGGFVLV